MILRAVASPPVLLGATPDLTKGSGGAALLVYLFTLDGFMTAIAFALAHGVAIWLTWRDPDCVRVWRSWFKCRKGHGRSLAPWPSFLPAKGNRYVP
jgi:hypothetical protein